MTKGRCKHCSHQGLKIVCALGLDPEAMAKASAAPGDNYRDGLLLRIPCDSREWDLRFFRHGGEMSDGQKRCIDQKSTCDKFADPTDEEIAAHDKAMTAAMNRMQLIVPLIKRIKKEHRGESWAGIEVCPACQGKLHLSIASINGHVWGQCETSGCVNWVE